MVVQATAEMLRFCRSLPRQSNPSILTAAGLCPNFIRAHPDPWNAEDGDDARVARAGDGGSSPSLLKWASWITGFDALLGGEPKKNGGDEAARLSEFSIP